MQLRMKIVHVVGCFSLIDIDGTVFSKEGVIQTAFYAPGDDAEKQAKLDWLMTYAQGITRGWELARNALSSTFLSPKVEEFQPKVY